MDQKEFQNCILCPILNIYLYNLIYDYWLGVLTGDTVVERITDFDGVKREQLEHH